MFFNRQWVRVLAAFSLALIGGSLDGLISPADHRNILLAVQPSDTALKTLIGKWQLPANLAYGMIFTSDGKVYISIAPMELMQLRYEIDEDFKPNLITFLDSEGKIVGSGIFELTDNGQLKLEFNLLGEVQRPNLSFSSQSILLEKTSEQTFIPYGMTITTPNASQLKEEADQNSQIEAKQYIAIMNRGNETIYSEQGLFKPTLEEVIKNMPSETTHYSYKIIVIDEQRMVQSVALAKQAGYKSYIGIVYRIQSSQGDDFSTKSIVCESNQPTQEIPQSTILFNNTDVQCPVGYSLLTE